MDLTGVALVGIAGSLDAMKMRTATRAAAARKTIVVNQALGRNQFIGSTGR
jgi:hypothetical protein